MPIERAAILVVVVADAILLAVTSFRLEASPQLRILADLIPLAGAFVICRRWRRFPRTTERLAHLIRTTFSLALFAQWADLRNGTLRTINPLYNQGLVVFPSFHTILAMLCIFAARPLRFLKYPLLALNLLIILASPAMGGHYFIDIIAGIILAALTISLPGYILSGIWRLKKIRHADAPVFASK
jgi:membrane-associated phospholipid phosphatase